MMPDDVASLWVYLSERPLTWLTVTVGAYAIADQVAMRARRHPLLNPVVIAALLVIALLTLTGTPFPVYFEGAQFVHFMLGPATVALGIPLYQQMYHIRAMWRPIVVTLPIAATMAAVYAVVIGWALGATPEVLASLAPKSVTAPIAIGITEQLGGSVPLMMGGLLITGVVATLFVDLLARLLPVQDERILGFALGLNGHAIGTARAFEISHAAGAFASLGMGLTGVFTALILPLVFRL